jgi:hypothetical protein
MLEGEGGFHLVSCLELTAVVLYLSWYPLRHNYGSCGKHTGTQHRILHVYEEYIRRKSRLLNRKYIQS